MMFGIFSNAMLRKGKTVSAKAALSSPSVHAVSPADALTHHSPPRSMTMSEKEGDVSSKKRHIVDKCSHYFLRPAGQITYYTHEHVTQPEQG